MWKNVLITTDTPIVKAIEIIDRAGLQIALVVNDYERANNDFVKVFK